MPSVFGQLEAGQEISRKTFVLDASVVDRYLSAVDDSADHLTASGESLVPPMAIAALGLRGVIEDLGIPGGTVHASQELDFAASVTAGETLLCVAEVAQNSTRGDWRFMVVRMHVSGEDERNVMDGRSTLMIPAHL